MDRLDGVEGHKDSVYSVAFAPNGRSLVSGSLDKTIKLWDLADARGIIGQTRAKCVRTFEGHKVRYFRNPSTYKTSINGFAAGFRPQRCLDTQWRLGAERLEGSRGAILERGDWGSPPDAPGPQELW